MEAKKKEPKIKRIRRDKADVNKGADIMKYCGIIKLEEDPQAIQKRLRNEWR
ncbi:MAG: hypothetical protein JWP69_886 [Flaviaesturariibacter sp.]|nr:hypothetical protein [Flaviaesturariibacter sp.]